MVLPSAAWPSKTGVQPLSCEAALAPWLCSQLRRSVRSMVARGPSCGNKLAVDDCSGTLPMISRLLEHLAPGTHQETFPLAGFPGYSTCGNSVSKETFSKSDAKPPSSKESMSWEASAWLCRMSADVTVHILAQGAFVALPRMCGCTAK